MILDIVGTILLTSFCNLLYWMTLQMHAVIHLKFLQLVKMMNVTTELLSVDFQTSRVKMLNTSVSSHVKNFRVFALPIKQLLFPVHKKKLAKLTKTSPCTLRTLTSSTQSYSKVCGSNWSLLDSKNNGSV